MAKWYDELKKEVIRITIEDQYNAWRRICMHQGTQYDTGAYTAEAEFYGMLRIAKICGAITEEEWDELHRCVNVIDWVNTYKGLTA